MADGFTKPSREQFRDDRNKIRAERRRKLVGVPVTIAALALIGAGVYKFVSDDTETIPTEVGGTSVTRVDSSTTTTFPEVSILDNGVVETRPEATDPAATEVEPTDIPNVADVTTTVPN